jgi:phenylalanyl-tRNA synthetase beta chain
MKLSLYALKYYVSLNSSAEEIAERLTMAGLEVKAIEKRSDTNDTLFEAEITSNRADWLSHIGVARELSAIFKKPLRIPKVTFSKKIDSKLSVSISIQDKNLCPYYSAVVLEDVEFGASPEWMQRCLIGFGIRPINLVVDVTNFVLMECGQPLHAFDLKCLEGPEITVRAAREKEIFWAINDKKYELQKTDIVIADKNGPVALGGVMGGKESEVTATTRHILLESAYFQPVAIRRTSRRLALSSDSSYRFERKVDPAGVVWAQQRAIQLLCQFGKVGKVGRVLSVGKLPVIKRVISLSVSAITQTLGVEIKAVQVKSILTSLGCKVTGSGKSFRISVPSFRPDLQHDIDLIEELARIYGYDKIPETLPKMSMGYSLPDPLVQLENTLRSTMTSQGFFETVTFSLVSEKPYVSAGFDLKSAVRLINPRNQELGLMRPSMLCSLLESVKNNVFQKNMDLALFEIGRTYARQDNALPREEKKIAATLTGTRFSNWLDHKRDSSLFDLKGIVNLIQNDCGLKPFEFKTTSHPFLEETIEIQSSGQIVGFLGSVHSKLLSLYDLHQKVYVMELSLENLIQKERAQKTYVPISRFPSSMRDIALFVSKEVKTAQLFQAIQEKGSVLLKQVELFDVYEGKSVPKGARSLAFRLEFLDDERTLEAGEVNALHETIVRHLKDCFDATLR